MRFLTQSCIIKASFQDHKKIDNAYLWSVRDQGILGQLHPQAGRVLPVFWAALEPTTSSPGFGE